ncbi:hypothetical protein [Chryseobacterium sp.]|uniref:hypothetical protein n=1 Tax=Chryseobacterium sp. TaxID=1871047 RepID=UPI0025BB66C5|nr:hypothetical protein [Chryseobacterium sp.]MBV8325244.1 hypothetical protein [Chryseobacterium sp.]
MPEYYAKLNDSLSFELTRDSLLMGRLIYESWFTFNAEIEIKNRFYHVEPKGFWGTTIELKDNERVILKFRMNWNGEIVIQTYFDGIKEGYLFKHRGMFKESFVMISQQGEELFVMKPHLKWSALHYEYHITTTERFETFSNKEILLLNALHCANYYMSMMVVV